MTARGTSRSLLPAAHSPFLRICFCGTPQLCEGAMCGHAAHFDCMGFKEVPCGAWYCSACKPAGTQLSEDEQEDEKEKTSVGLDRMSIIRRGKKTARVRDQGESGEEEEKEVEVRAPKRTRRATSSSSSSSSSSSNGKRRFGSRIVIAPIAYVAGPASRTAGTSTEQQKGHNEEDKNGRESEKYDEKADAECVASSSNPRQNSDDFVDLTMTDSDGDGEDQRADRMTNV